MLRVGNADALRDTPDRKVGGLEQIARMRHPADEQAILHCRAETGAEAAREMRLRRAER